MKIYIDFDDVICETAKYFTKIAKELFNIDVPYREVQFFNLQKSFDLSGEQYDELMKAGHIPENLLDYEETPGASEVINKWVVFFIPVLKSTVGSKPVSLFKSSISAQRYIT